MSSCLEHIVRLGLLDSPAEDAVYSRFPTASVVVLVNETIGALRDGKQEALAAPSHVEHVLCTLGMAFALPWTHLEVTMAACKLYKTWAFDEKKRPRVFAAQEQHFLRIMIRHLSQVFDVTSKGRQATDPEAVTAYAKLCDMALDILSVLGSQRERLEPRTSRTLLLTLLGIADYTWTSTPSTVSAGPLSERVGAVMFEVWVLSGTEDAALWLRLTQLFPGWCHLMSVVVTWKGVAVALTQRLLNLLYGASEGLPFLRLSIAPKAKVDDKFVYYAWSRFINLLGNLAGSTASEQTFLEVFVAVRALVILFLEVGRESVKIKGGKETSSGGAPLSATDMSAERNFSGVNGNTLLHLFGKFIFDAVISNQPQRQLGTAMATQVMCEIFVVCSANTTFKRAHLARFYTALARVLLLPDVGSTLVAVLRYCNSIFTYALPGSHVLIPPFVHAVARVMSYNGASDNRIDAAAVRRYALSTLSTLICLPAHFQDAPLYPLVLGGAVRDAPLLSVASYKDLNRYYGALIADTMTKFEETNPDNVNLLLWIHFVHSVQNASFVDVLKFCQRTILSSSSSLGNALTALACISSLAACPEALALPALGPQCVKLLMEHLRSAVKLADKSVRDTVVTACLYSLCDWIVCHGRVLADTATMTSLSTSVVSMVADESEARPVREAARHLLVSMLNNYGQWPPSTGNVTLSSAQTESSILSQMISSVADERDANAILKSNVRYFCLEQVGFLTVIERIDLADTVTIIWRDKKGRWVYNLTMAQAEGAARPPPTAASTSIDPVDVGSNQAAIDPSRLVSIYAFFKAAPSLNDHPLVARNIAQEAADAVKDVPASSSTTRANPPARPTNPALGRTLLSNLGLLSLHQKSRFHAVDQTMNFYRDLKQLDLTSERECQRIGVCYVPSGATTLAASFMTPASRVSPAYVRFLGALGWAYNMRENRQNVYTGGVDDALYGADVLPYFGNHASEMVFIPMHLLACSLELKVRIMSAAHVVIIWCEDLDGYNPAFFPTTRAHVVVTPLAKLGLFHSSFVDTSKRSEGTHGAIGPITDKTVLSQALLAPMVRLTVSNAFRAYQPRGQFTARQAKINLMMEKHARHQTVADFYASLFKPLGDDQLAPPIRLTAREVLASATDDDDSSQRKSALVSPRPPVPASPPEYAVSPRVTPEPKPAASPVAEPAPAPAAAATQRPLHMPPVKPAEPAVKVGSPAVIDQPRPVKAPEPAFVPPLSRPAVKASEPLPVGSPSGSAVLQRRVGPPLPSGSPMAAERSGPPLPSGSPMVARKPPTPSPPVAEPAVKTIRIVKDSGTGRARRLSGGRGAPPMPGGGAGGGEPPK